MKKNKISLYSLDQFFNTIKGMPKYRNLTRVQLAGFHRAMQNKDMLFVYNPQDYLKELDHYLNG